MKNNRKTNSSIIIPPRGIAILTLLGPSIVWVSEYIGSGEVILATRTGAILGPSILGAVVIGIFLKYWIGMSGARYTVCTGEGMIDMFSRIPGPRNWVVWMVLIVQFISGTLAIGSIATAAGVFVNSLIPISPYFGGWLVAIFALGVVWTGVFDILKMIMSIFVLIIILGVLYVAISVLPDLSDQWVLFSLTIPEAPPWALGLEGVSSNPWREILPLLGWAAGGFASQVWYTYWVIGAGYGATRGRGYGQPTDVVRLQNMTRKTADRIKGWCKVVYTDATLAMLMGTIVTSGFLIAGAGVLGPNQLAPQGTKVATTLATIFSTRWGWFGGFLFRLVGAVALIGTLLGLLAGWPRLLADSFRICFPGYKRRFTWKIQFRMFLVFFFFTNMIIVYALGLKPVMLVKLSAVMDGLLLTPLQALWIAIGLYLVLPKLLSQEARKVLKPHWIFAVGLGIGFLVFGYFCIFQVPFVL